MKNSKFILPSFLGGFLGIFFGGLFYVLEGIENPLVVLFSCISGFLFGALFTGLVKVNIKFHLRNFFENIFYKVFFVFCWIFIFFIIVGDFFGRVIKSIKWFFTNPWKFISKIKEIKINIKFEPLFKSEKERNVFRRSLMRVFASIITISFILFVFSLISKYLFGLNIFSGGDLGYYFSKHPIENENSLRGVFSMGFIFLAIIYFFIPSVMLPWGIESSTFAEGKGKKGKYFEVKLCGKNPFLYLVKVLKANFLIYFWFFYPVLLTFVFFGIISLVMTVVMGALIIVLFLFPYFLAREYLKVTQKRKLLVSFIICLVVTFSSYYIYMPYFFYPMSLVACAFSTGIFSAGINVLILENGEKILNWMYSFEEKSKKKYSNAEGWGESIISYSGELWNWIWKTYRKLPSLIILD